MERRAITRLIGVLLTASLLNSALTSQESWRVEAGVTFRHFQQQVKAEVGQPRGDRLVNEFELGALLSGMYRVHEYLSVGAFVRIDRGERLLARFAGFDATGRTQVKDALGGLYTEFWVGPLLHSRWKQLSLEIGFAPIGVRNDMARTDLPSSTGDTEAAFSLHPTIAWLLSLGANVPLADHLELIVKVEYRPRYYSKRGGNPIVGDIEHGTQSVAPLIGLAWKW